MQLNDILKYYSESFNIDFKQTEYPLGKEFKKNEFLKDFSAMANHPSDEKKYIFVGVIEKDGRASSFIDIPKLTDQAKYNNFLTIILNLLLILNIGNLNMKVLSLDVLL